MKRLHLLVLLQIPLVIVLGACRSGKNKVESFYTNRGDWDDSEIPLLKPYKLIRLNGEQNWMMNLVGTSFAFSVDSIRQVNVIGNLVLLEGHCNYNGQASRRIWIVAIPDKNIERGFVSYHDYTDFMRTLRFKAPPELYRIEEVATYAGNNDIIEWNKIKSYK